MISPEYSGLRADRYRHALERLRKKAEQQLADQPPAPVGPKQAKQAVQELQVHQIELEVQYEELLVMQAETESLRARYTDLFDFAPVGYVVFDVLGVIQEVNQRAAQLLGSTRARLKERRLLLFVMPECREDFLRFTVDVMGAEEHGQTLDLHMCREDGAPFYARLDGLAIPDPWGNRQCRLAITDTTAQHQMAAELKNAVAALCDGEARFQCLFAHSDDAMVLLRNNYVLACNEAAMRLFGTTDENDLLGRHLAAGLPATQPDGRTSRVVADEGLAWALRAGNANFEWVRQRADTAELMWHEVRLTPLTQTADTLVHAVLRDITLHRQQEYELQAKDDALQLSLRLSGGGLWTWDPHAERLTLDARTRQILRGHPDLIPGDEGTLPALLASLHPDDRARAEAEIRRSFDSPAPQVLEWRAVWPDGSLHHVASVAQFQPGLPGIVTRLSAVVMEVSDTPA